jgi:hypothetical protein
MDRVTPEGLRRIVLSLVVANLALFAVVWALLISIPCGNAGQIPIGLVLLAFVAASATVMVVSQRARMSSGWLGFTAMIQITFGVGLCLGAGAVQFSHC